MRDMFSPVVLAAAALLLLAGCSGSDEPDAAPSSPVTSSGEGDSLAAAPRTTSNPSEPLPVLASRETSAASGSRAIALRVEVNELTRRDDLLLVNLTVNNVSDGGPGWQIAGFFDDGNLQQPPEQQTTADGITLIDTAGRKRHLVARDSEGGCVCTEALAGAFLPAGERLTITATFAAPPAGVKTMDVVVPGVGTFAAVPVT